MVSIEHPYVEFKSAVQLEVANPALGRRCMIVVVEAFKEYYDHQAG